MNSAIPQLALSPRDAAQALSMSEKGLWNLTKPRGPIPAAKIGRLVRYDVKDLQAFLDAQKTAAGEE
jgi:predicted DNA-binding transcriptional regulator AlpA